MGNGTGRKAPRSGGFTITEMLAAVAVLVILFSVAVPGLIAMQKRLRIARMDRYARTVFLTVQNELTAMKSAGDLSELRTGIHTQALPAAPADYPSGDESWADLYYLSSASDNPASRYLLCADTVLSESAAEGSTFLLELDPASGSVYSAFYCEEAFSYRDVLALASRAQSDREKKMLGYYCGGKASAVGLPEYLYPSVSVSNGEELRADVTCPNLLTLADRQTAMLLTVTVTSADGGEGKYEKSFQGGSDFTVTDGSAHVSLVLDSLEEENAFSAVTAGSGLVPGENLLITAAMTYTDRGTTIPTAPDAANSATVNSLFAGRTNPGQAGDSIAVSAVRHLNNLRTERFPYAGSGGVTITQTQPVDFRLVNWKPLGDAYPASWTQNPLAEFSPVENAALFRNGTVYNGNQNAITGFSIQGKECTGLFSALSGCTLENIRLEDTTVAGTGAVGAVAGRITDTTVVNCGAYLVSRDALGRYLGKAAMDAKTAACSVSGSADVGGLIGQAAGTCPVSASFAAQDVAASGSCAGGLVGRFESGAVTKCYASGSVAAASHGGGLIGYAAAARVSDCYSTSNVTAEAYGGGLLGGTGSGSALGCRSYGRILKRDGTMDTAASGGFAGSGGAAFQGCTYLTQVNYNIGFSSVGGVSAEPYAEVDGAAASGNCYPYRAELSDKYFPFTLITVEENGSSRTMPHYGDWPARYQLQTSLVYYERYADGTYGYYAFTSLTAAADSGGTNRWMVNTLTANPQNDCVEDGYAVVSVSELSSLSYTLSRWTGSAVPTTVSSGTLSAGNGTGAGKAALLESGASLRFTNAGYPGQTYTLSNAWVYQLPFSLQVTGRTKAVRFYDRLVMTGTDAGGRTAFENYSFYYCPDFAKNAVNPGLTGGDAYPSSEPGGSESNPVYIRSARQLNLLGRTPYYWNTNQGGSTFYYLQELDIDFGHYTTAYCGVSYNLSDTSQSNPYRNMPIGCPSNSAGGQFKATYDGGGHRIIDFRCHVYSSDRTQKYRFAGLFGEVYKATLKNIVMTASDPENASAYVISEFDQSNTAEAPGVGALAGLIYIDKADSGSVRTVVQNCAVSGCTVSYSGTVSRECAVGGLVGYNFGTIVNCSAVSYRVSASGSGSRAAYVGGLIGSDNGMGSAVNCYAGGTLSVTSASGKAGGLIGGLSDIFGYAQGDNAKKRMSLTNCYSYCMPAGDLNAGVKLYGVCPEVTSLTVTDCSFLKNTGNSAAAAVSGATDRTAAQLAALSYPASGTARASGTADASGSFPWSASLTGSAYPYPAEVMNSAGTYVHYGDWPAVSALTENVYLAYYERYSDGTWGFLTLDDSGRTSATLDTAGAKTISAAGYGLLVRSGANFTMEIADGSTPTLSSSAAVGALLKSGLTGGYSLYAFSAAAQAGLSTLLGWNVDYTAVTLTYGGEAHTCCYMPDYVFLSETEPSGDTAQIRTAEQLQKMSGYRQGRIVQFVQTHDIAALSGTGWIDGNSGAGYTFDGGGCVIDGLTKPLFNAVGSASTLENVRLTNAAIALSQNAAALCLTNSGVITQCCAQGSVTGTNAAGLVYTNYGTIQRSYANCSVKSTAGIASGFLVTHYGTAIEDCYVSGTVTAKTVAYGFSGTQNGSAISRCYVAAEIAGQSKAYGFKQKGSSSNLTACFWLQDTGFNSSVTATGGVTACTATELAGKLSALNQSGTCWALDTTGAHTALYASAAEAYPYPYLIWTRGSSTADEGIHYGVWALMG